MSIYFNCTVRVKFYLTDFCGIQNYKFTMNKRKFCSRAKGVNCNKPLKAERERQFREEFGRPQTSIERSHDRPPPGLKGKDIGLWYRNRNRRREIKPPAFALDSSTQREIENVLSNTSEKAFNAEKEYGVMKEGAFKEKFMKKISVTFEEKLDQMEAVKIEQDPLLDEMLYEELIKKHHCKTYKEMFEFRRSLPAYSRRKDLVDLIEKNQVVVISGATGCGKSTQIVQYILDHYIKSKKGSLYKAICTQPRRISAVTVSERVAAERGERLGESVGYVIRLESEVPARSRGSIIFETTGILTQSLQSDPVLNGVSHLFIDEIHERNSLCDFLLTLLKYIIPKRPDLRVILMSASLNAEKFSEYFGGVPCFEIPGFTFPIKDFYLEDILQKVPFKFPEPRKWSKKFDPIFQDHVLPYVKTLSSQNVPAPVLNELRNPESEFLNIDLIMAVILHICNNEPEGAILVFVPGLSQIQDLNKLLTNGHFNKISVFPMHSILPTVNQKMAFARPPPGIRKIIISTSIAETSITIDDVRYVVDCGKHKTKSFDLNINVSTLEPEWESVANAVQRRGRAGRTQPGKCYKLYTRAREETFEPFPLPEIQRTRLEEVILNAKVLQLGRVEQFLEKLMDPPDPKAVKLSLKMLRTLNVLDSEERLTPLGYHLAKLPMDPQTGKMILMGALFGCVDPVLSIAACLNFKDPFVFVLNEEHRIHKIRKGFSEGEKSDHLVLSNAFRGWEEAQRTGSGNAFAYANFLSNHNLILMRNMKRQFARYLKEMKFLRSDDPKDPQSNINSNNVKLVEAVICSGLYPNVAMISRVIRSKVNKAVKRILWKTIDHPRVEFHSKSLLNKISDFESPYVVYFEKIKSSSILLYDGTMVNPMTLLFFGERLDIVEEGKEYYIRIDDMIKFTCLKKNALLVQKLRNQLLWILEEAISNPGVVDWGAHDKKTCILKSIVELITSEDSRSLADYGVETV